MELFICPAKILYSVMTKSSEELIFKGEIQVNVDYIWEESIREAKWEP